MLDKFRHIHFIGIGGSGISSIAYLALAHGLKVTGSDIALSPVIKELENEGATIYIGHKKENVHELAELVVYTEAIDKKTNPEFLEAKKRGMPLMSYFEALGNISAHPPAGRAGKKTVAVIGTHGKTTTTAMLGEAAIASGMDPTVIAGSQVPAFKNRNIYIGHGEWFILEACEYRRSFLNLAPFGAVFLNCEPDHLDYYKDEKDYVSAFAQFVKKIPKEGFLVFNEQDKNCKKLSKECAGKLIPVKQADIKKLDLNLSVPGEFNKSNAAHAYMAAIEIGGESKVVKKALEKFSGTARRLEFKGEKNGIRIYDDYAHHPTEIKASLKALRDKFGDKRIICVYQPHQYSRTYAFLDELKNSFADADMVLIPNIYAARDTEEDKKRVSAEELVSLINQTESKTEKSIWTKDFPNTLDHINKTAKSGDILVIMGAGDIYKITENLLQ